MSGFQVETRANPASPNHANSTVVNFNLTPLVKYQARSRARLCTERHWAINYHVSDQYPRGSQEINHDKRPRWTLTRTSQPPALTSQSESLKPETRTDRDRIQVEMASRAKAAWPVITAQSRPSVAAPARPRRAGPAPYRAAAARRPPP